MNMTAAAIRYAQAGLYIFPCWTVLKADDGFVCACGRGDCSHKGKHPLGSIVHQGYQTQPLTLSRSSIGGSFKPDANIGLALDGFIVIDVDPRHGGDRSLVGLEAQYGSLPKTRRARSGGGGEHIFFRSPAGVTVKNDNKGGLAQGLDIKTKGGYVMAAPSLHESGNRYEWIDNIPAVEPPAWLTEKLHKKRSQGCNITRDSGVSLLVVACDDGQRDVTVTKLTGHLLRRFVDPAVVFELIKAWNEARVRPPLPYDDICREFVNSLFCKEGERIKQAAEGRRWRQ